VIRRYFFPNNANFRLKQLLPLIEKYPTARIVGDSYVSVEFDDGLPENARVPEPVSEVESAAAQLVRDLNRAQALNYLPEIASRMLREPELQRSMAEHERKRRRNEEAVKRDCEREEQIQKELDALVFPDSIRRKK
jgi:hypothetical protein